MTQNPSSDDLFGDNASKASEPELSLYDSIMKEIEPELMTSVYPTLEEKYKDETVEEKQAREVRYKEALEQFDRILDSISQEAISRSREEAQKRKAEIEEQESAERQSALDKAEKNLDSAA